MLIVPHAQNNAPQTHHAPRTNVNSSQRISSRSSGVLPISIFSFSKRFLVCTQNGRILFSNYHLCDVGYQIYL